MNLFGNNEKARKALQEASKYGKTPKEAFYAAAKAKGVNPDDILKSLR